MEGATAAAAVASPAFLSSSEPWPRTAGSKAAAGGWRRGRAVVVAGRINPGGGGGVAASDGVGTAVGIFSGLEGDREVQKSEVWDNSGASTSAYAAPDGEDDGGEKARSAISGGRWERRSTRDVWMAPKSKSGGAAGNQAREQSAEAPGPRRSANATPKGGDAVAVPWAERANAMEELTDASDIGAALFRVGKKLGIADLNAVLRRLGRSGKWPQSLLLFDWMKKHGKLNAPTYTSFFSVAGKAGEVETALQVFSELRDRETRSNIYVWNALLGTLVSNEKVEKAFYFFRLLKGEGINPDRVTYSTMISGCSKALGGFYKAQELVNEMKEKGFKLDSVMYGALINVCAHNHMVEEARAKFDEMLAEGFAPNLFHFSALLNSYAAKGRHKEAEEIVAEIKKSGLRPNKVVYNTMINAYSRAKLPEKAREIFQEMSERGLTPDMISYCSLMDAYGKLGQAEEAQDVFDQMKAAGLMPGSNSYSILMAAYGRSGDLTMIKKLNQEMDGIRGCKLDIHFFNRLLKVYCHAGVMDGIMETLRKMDTQACFPNRTTFHILLAFFCFEGLHDLTMDTYRDMEARGFPPNEITYNIIIQGFLKHGNVQGALQLLTQMEDRGLLPTKMIYQHLMRSFVSHRMPNEAAILVKSMKASGSVVSPELLEGYLEILVEEGRLDDVKDVLQVMKGSECSLNKSLLARIGLKANAQHDYGLLKEVREESTRKPSSETTNMLLDNFGAMGSTDRLQSWSAIERDKVFMEDG